MDKLLFWLWIGAALVAVGGGLLAWWRQRSKTQEEDKDRLQVIYFGAALHYYIVGRYATIAQFVPTAGNLIHHAIEFFLKAALIEQLDETARRNLSHNLRRLWRRYKRQRRNPALDKFDQTIRDIDKIERIRYAEKMIELGMLVEIGFVRNPYAPPPGAKRPRAERYQMALDEVDELVKLIFQIEGVNPRFFTDSLHHEDAERYLIQQNKFPLK